MDTAKVFMTGRSQAVRLPKAYRFDTNEVLIEKQADGAVVLRPKRRDPLGDRLWAILEGLPDDPSFARPDQGEPEVRDWQAEPKPKVRKTSPQTQSKAAGKTARIVERK